MNVYRVLACFLTISSSPGPMAAHDTQFFRRCVRSIPPFICGCNTVTTTTKIMNEKRGQWRKHKCQCTNTPECHSRNTRLERKEKEQSPANPRVQVDHTHPSAPVDNFFVLATKNMRSNHWFQLLHAFLISFHPER